ncbi:MAG: 16S rRNA (cytosine(1402)-N(4))-methyltransferase, partial [Bdellovibrionales bacterium]|nr:16S rRNA (cytosine(1402)-N(4))-methyltransferase [Bdellovibrionales bacterium]
GWRKKGSHPATPYFLALRLKVNEELEGLSYSLPKMIPSLNRMGRLFVLSFHSLEDRIVKNIFKKAHKKEGYNLTKKVILPSREEIKRNPRARSAKLRVFERR